MLDNNESAVTVEETNNAFKDFDKIVQEQKKRITRMIGLAVLGEVLVVTGLCVGAYFLGKSSR
jgi:hypothetical protein